MKLIIPTIFLFFCFQTQAQLILKKNNRFGLQQSDGSVIIPIEYDTVYKVKSSSDQNPIYVYAANNRFGMYFAQDSSLTGLIFDELKIDDEEPIFMRIGSKWGFVAVEIPPRLETDYNAPRIPIYHLIMPMYESIHQAWNTSMHELSVQNNSLYGLISCQTGDTIVPLKFNHSFRSIQPSNNKTTYISESSNGKDSIVIYHPEKALTFYFASGTEIKIPYSDSLLIAFHQFITDATGILEVYNYNSGKRIFHYDIERNYIAYEDYSTNYELLNYRTIKIHTEYTKKGGTSPFHVISCYDIYTGYRYYYSESQQFSDLIVRHQKGDSKIYKVDDYDKFPEKNIVGLLKANHEITWYYERFSKP